MVGEVVGGKVVNQKSGKDGRCDKVAKLWSVQQSYIKLSGDNSHPWQSLKTKEMLV